jgi:hypothetical protein
MPGLDRTGPRGEGPRTGGGWGRCGSAAGPLRLRGGGGYGWGGPGRGGRGRGGRGGGRGWYGGGRGFGGWWGGYARTAVTPAEEIGVLESTIRDLEGEIAAARRRLDALRDSSDDS